MLSLLATSAPWIHEKAKAEKALKVLQFVYPIVLLCFFIFAFAARSVLSAAPKDDYEEAPPRIQYGPGGKPLPVRSQSFKRVVQRDFSRLQKLVFEWLSVALCLTWIGNAAVVIVHALYSREEGWWVGEAPTVSLVEHIAYNHKLLTSAAGVHCWRFLRILAAPHIPRRHETVANEHTSSYVGCGLDYRG